MGRPKGSKDKKQRGYTMSAEAWHHRVCAPLRSGNSSKIMDAVFENLGVPDDKRELLIERKMDIWKRFQTPVLMLVEEYTNLKVAYEAKLLVGSDPSSKELLNMTKVLLEISKEINRLTQVSANKKFEAFTKKFDSEGSEDLIIEVEANAEK